MVGLIDECLRSFLEGFLKISLKSLPRYYHIVNVNTTNSHNRQKYKKLIKVTTSLIEDKSQWHCCQFIQFWWHCSSHLRKHFTFDLHFQHGYQCITPPQRATSCCFFFLFVLSSSLLGQRQAKVTATLQLVCGSSLPAALRCRGFCPHLSVTFQLALCRAAASLLLASWQSGDNYGMSGGSPSPTDKAISGVFLPSIVQLALKRQKGRHPCEVKGWVTLFSSLGIEMQSSMPAVSGGGC